SLGAFEDTRPLKVLDIELPPLRARRHEIAGLTTRLLAQLNAAYGCHVELEAETFATLSQYDWPGNFRELTEALRRVVRRGDDSALRRELESRLTRLPSACRTA